MHPTATKQRWQPASQVVQVKDLPAVESEICDRTTPPKKEDEQPKTDKNPE